MSTFSSTTRPRASAQDVLRSARVAPGVPAPVQTRLKVGAPHDPLEAEADRVADHVMRMTGPVGAAPQGRVAALVQRDAMDEQEDSDAIARVPTGPVVQRKCAACDEEQVQRKEGQPTGRSPLVRFATNDVAAGIERARAAGGHELPERIRGFAEPRFGHDFSNVRVHTDSASNALAAGLHARAFTVGRDVFFAQGQFQPEARGGQRLIAHELAHTIQQGPSRAEPRASAIVRRAPAPGTASSPIPGAPASPLPGGLGTAPATRLPAGPAIRTPADAPDPCLRACDDKAAKFDRIKAKAASRLDEAIQALRNVGGTTRQGRRAARGIQLFFGSPDVEVAAPVGASTAMVSKAARVHADLAQVRAKIATTDLMTSERRTQQIALPVHCETGDCAPAKKCAGSLGVYSPAQRDSLAPESITLCKSLWEQSFLVQQSTLIHEVVHATFPGGPDVYTRDRFFALLGVIQDEETAGGPPALRNPDSLAAFAMFASGTTPRRAAPRTLDRFVGFRGDPTKQREVEHALAFAGRWLLAGAKSLEHLVQTMLEVRSTPSDTMHQPDWARVRFPDRVTLAHLRGAYPTPATIEDCASSTPSFPLNCPQSGTLPRLEDVTRVKRILRILEFLAKALKGTSVSVRLSDTQEAVLKFESPGSLGRLFEVRDKLTVGFGFFRLTPKQQRLAVVHALRRWKLTNSSPAPTGEFEEDPFAAYLLRNYEYFGER